MARTGTLRRKYSSNTPCADTAFAANTQSRSWTWVSRCRTPAVHSKPRLPLTINTGDAACCLDWLGICGVRCRPHPLSHCNRRLALSDALHGGNGHAPPLGTWQVNKQNKTNKWVCCKCEKIAGERASKATASMLKRIFTRPSAATRGSTPSARDGAAGAGFASTSPVVAADSLPSGAATTGAQAHGEAAGNWDGPDNAALAALVHSSKHRPQSMKIEHHASAGRVHVVRKQRRHTAAAVAAGHSRTQSAAAALPGDGAAAAAALPPQAGPGFRVASPRGQHVSSRCVGDVPCGWPGAGPCGATLHRAPPAPCHGPRSGHASPDR